MLDAVSPVLTEKVQTDFVTRTIVSGALVSKRAGKLGKQEALKTASLPKH
jgi:hypothetical protein